MEHNLRWSQDGIRGDQVTPKTLADSMFQSAYSYYANTQYEQAIELNLSYMKDSVFAAIYGDEANLVLGNIFLQLEPPQPDSALKYLNAVSSKEPELKSYADWYRSLAYLFQNDAKEAINHLLQIPQGTDKYVAAQELLKKIE